MTGQAGIRNISLKRMSHLRRYGWMGCMSTVIWLSPFHQAGSQGKQIPLISHTVYELHW